jgi:hypothetical protein
MDIINFGLNLPLPFPNSARSRVKCGKRGAMASASVFGSGLTSTYQYAEGCRFESGRFRFVGGQYINFLSTTTMWSLEECVM